MFHQSSQLRISYLGMNVPPVIPGEDVGRLAGPLGLGEQLRQLLWQRARKAFYDLNFFFKLVKNKKYLISSIDCMPLTHLIDLFFEYLLLAQLTAKRSCKIIKSPLVVIYKLPYLAF